MREPVLMFDFGNVVAYFDYLAMCRRFGARVGLPGEILFQRLTDQDLPRLLAAFESGQVEPREFSREVMAMAGLKIPYEEFVADWEDIFTLNETVAQLIGTLKRQGYTLVLGSNTNVLHSTFYRRKFAPALDAFDRMVFSHEVGRLKPDPLFYRACVDAVGADAGRCVFIDDVEKNVDGARAAGLHGLQYRDTPGLIEGLRSLGVEVAAGEV